MADGLFARVGRDALHLSQNLHPLALIALLELVSLQFLGVWAMAEWHDGLSVGNAALDDDHKAFYRACLLLSEVGNECLHPSIVQTAIFLLKDYLTGHIFREESAMRLAQVPDLEEHVNQHVKFEILLRSLISEYESGNLGALNNLVIVAKGWQDSHIVEMDLKYKDLIVDADVDPRPLGLLAAELYEGPDSDPMTVMQ